MKALVKTAKGVGNIELKELPTPIPGDTEVLIRVQSAGVCGTDVHVYYDRFANSPPFTLGHEFSGIIEKVGQDVQTLKEGDRVVSANNPFACGSCKICSIGYPNLCSSKKAMGIHSDGSFAEYVKLPATLIHRIPENISFEEAALTEPLAVAVHSVSHRCGINQDDSVIILGPGAIGLLAAQVARAEGAGRIILAGTSNDEKVRFACARKLNLEVLNVEKEDLFTKVMDVTDGVGVDAIVEASGSKRAITDAVKLLRKNGRMSISGLTGQPEISLPWDQMVSKGISLFFSYSSVNSDWEKALMFLSEHKVSTAPLITHNFELEQWQDAFNVLETMDAIRPILKIGGKI